MASLHRKAVLKTPAYPFVEAAHYLHVPVTTLRGWCLGQDDEDRDALHRSRPIIRLDGKRTEGLSFLNLVEAHVLAAIRRTHQVPLAKVRSALAYVSEHLKLDRPLLQAQFATQGVDLFVEALDRVVNVSRHGQLEMSDLIHVHLERIERDPKGIPIRLYPFTRGDSSEAFAPAVVIDPQLGSGRPVLAGTAVPTSVLADRFKAGDSVAQLAYDYGAQPEAIEEGIRCELDCRQAA